ncbi:OTU domain-containing protein [Gracilariopsis chorda]|uniref:Ubiquitin thioesterase OTU n=1 Tax=Gracilariopsis chorda TaxID=448386 RepID=A0A2V3IDK7_9FLOR|nr:OTU domain-containing protein [Gracilariopsis chorda]|eukprot:PXF40154.1 OTU domain-containing protein [Gracilariopsis chorda]
MGLSAVLRWLRSSASPSSSPQSSRSRRAQQRPPPRDPREQERTVVAAYRARLLRLSAALSSDWVRFDAEPDNHALLLHIRTARPKLDDALDAYYAALGRRDPSAVAHQIGVMERTDVRLAAIDHNVLAEVHRFRHAANTVASRLTATSTPAERFDVAADANDVLVELELYRDGWLQLMDASTRSQLLIAATTLRNIVDSTPTRPPLPTSHPPPRRPRSRTNVDPSYVVNRPGHPPVTRPHDLSPASSTSSPHLNLNKPMSHPPTPPPSSPPPTRAPVFSHDRREDDVQGDPAPMRMIISRSRTLRDMAQVAMTTNKSGTRDIEDATARSSQPANPPETDQPSLSTTKNISFASALYRTHNRRIGSISDAGLRLRRSEVRGDGRCLFRSLVRCRFDASGLAIPSERVEKYEADQLRIRAVAELRQHRQLLARFFVIEGNFALYTRRMSNPRTYGGEPELLMLAKLLHVPIAVYILRNGKYRQIQVYGKQYRGEPYRILYSDGIHYDALLAIR